MRICSAGVRAVVCAVGISFAVAVAANDASGQRRRRYTPGPTVNAYTGAHLGYSKGAIGDLGFAPDREWWGVNVGINVRILSWLTANRDSGLVFYDLLYLDVDGLGKMTSDTLGYFGNGPLQGYESRHAFSWGFGYTLMAGVASETTLLTAGLRWESYNHEVGAMNMDGSVLPLAARLVFAPGERPFVVEGAYSLGGDNKLRSLSVNVPFIGLTHIGATYDQLEGTAISQLRAQDLTSPNPEGGVVPATWTRLSVSVRVLSGAFVGM